MSRSPIPQPSAARASSDSRMVGLDPAMIERLHRAARCIRDDDPATANAILTQVIAETRGHPEALRLLGLLRLRERRPADAIVLFRRALAVWRDDAMLHSDLASALAASGDIDAALKNWRKATRLDPDQGMPWFNLGRQLQLRGDSAEAADALAQAIARMPDFVPARILHADACLHLGRFDEAEAGYRSVLAKHPSCGDAWRGLANLKTRAFSDEDRAAMRAALDAPETTENDRIAIGFALGKAEEDAGHYSEALAAFSAANALQRKRAPWREAALRDYVEQILAATVTLPKPPNPNFGREVIFIVGLPRSGSTLLEQMLSAHPSVEGASELYDLGAVLIAESQRRGRPWPSWIADASAQDWLRLGRQYLQRTAHWRRQKPRHTDKLPENWKFVAVLRAMLPGAQVIEIRRDPLETAWSCYKQQFYELPHFACDFADIAAYMDLCQRTLDLLRARDPSHIHVQRYEALVADPESELRRLCAAIGLTFSSACLDYARAPRSVRTASAAQVRAALMTDTRRAVHYGTLLDPLRAALAARSLDAS